MSIQATFFDVHFTYKQLLLPKSQERLFRKKKKLFERRSSIHVIWRRAQECIPKASHHKYERLFQKQPFSSKKDALVILVVLYELGDMKGLYREINTGNEKQIPYLPMPHQRSRQICNIQRGQLLQLVLCNHILYGNWKISIHLWRHGSKVSNHLPLLAIPEVA